MHSNSKKVAIVILNWNGCKLMEKFLPSVIDYSPSELSEVVVADNGSTDASIAMLKEKFPSVRIIQLDKNYGFAEGYNQAIKQRSGHSVIRNISNMPELPEVIWTFTAILTAGVVYCIL